MELVPEAGKAQCYHESLRLPLACPEALCFCPESLQAGCSKLLPVSAFSIAMPGWASKAAITVAQLQVTGGGLC